MKSYQLYTKEDYLTYFLIYASYANFNLGEKEKNYILNNVSNIEYQRIHRVFKMHKEYEKLEVFDSFLQKFCYLEKEEIIIKMQDIFWSEGLFNSLEKIFRMYVTKIIWNCNSNQSMKEVLTKPILIKSATHYHDNISLIQ